MKKFYLLRHAKSGWDDPALGDFERPLAPRGVQACELMTAHFQTKGIQPDLILCSSAARAKATYNGVANAFADKSEVSFERGLYLAGAKSLLARLQEVGAEKSSVMMIGHNPGFEMLALALAGTTKSDAVDRMRVKFPTLALATFDVTAEKWAAVGAENVGLADFVVPRDLKAVASKN